MVSRGAVAVELPGRSSATCTSAKDACRPSLTALLSGGVAVGLVGEASSPAKPRPRCTASRGSTTRAPIELIASVGRRTGSRRPRRTHRRPDEVVDVGGLPVTSPARTALDLATPPGPRHPRSPTLTHSCASTGLAGRGAADFWTRYQRAPGLRPVDAGASDLMDGGCSRPKETLDCVSRLIDAGLPRPRTNIRCS